MLKLASSSSAVSKEHCELVQSSSWALVKEKGVAGGEGIRAGCCVFQKCVTAKVRTA